MSQAAIPLPGFETTIVTRAELSDEALKTLLDRMKGIFGQYDGGLVLEEDWGKRKLAYPIQKETRAHYSYLVYTGKGPVVAELERQLRIQDHVLRFMTVNLAKEFNPETFKKEREEARAAAKRRDEEREARREERFAERRAQEERFDRERGGHHGGQGHGRDEDASGAEE